MLLLDLEIRMLLNIPHYKRLTLENCILDLITDWLCNLSIDFWLDNKSVDDIFYSFVWGFIHQFVSQRVLLI